MVGRLLRVSCTVLAIAAAFAVPVVVNAAPASADTVVNGCTIVSSPTATNFTNCPNVDFSGANLTGVDLDFANLAGATFPNVDLSGTLFEHATLSQATLSGAKLTSCTAVQLTGSLQSWTCSGVDLQSANLQSANLSGTDLSGALVGSADLVGANISSVTWQVALSDCSVCPPNVTGTDQFFGAELTDANLSGLDLSGLELSGVTLTGANLTGAQLQNSSLSPVASSSSNITGADLAQTNFTDANLSGAELSSGNFTGATLTDANLTEANLAGATLTGATLTGANVTGTVLVPSHQEVAPTTSSEGAVVSWTTPAALPGASPGSCTPASGSTFPSGTTTVTCQVLDNQGGIATGTFTVAVDPAPTTSVLLPSNGAAVTGDFWIDAGVSAPAGVQRAVVDISGGSLGTSAYEVQLTPTLYGWIGAWNSTLVPNGNYTVESAVVDTGGVLGTSVPITITINNPPPSTSVIIPSTGATQSGTAALLDASSTADVTSLSYELTGGTLTNQVIATGGATIYGWLAEWNTTSVPNGTYTLQSVGTYSGGTVTSAPITITVSN